MEVQKKLQEQEKEEVAARKKILGEGVLYDDTFLSRVIYEEAGFASGADESKVLTYFRCGLLADFRFGTSIV